jgi:putative addiction module component (TIGR02574 family)
MATRTFDFSQLTAAERIQLAEELWDSLDPAEVTLSAAQAEELDRRRERLQREGSQGRPWRDVLEDLKKRGG